MLPHEQRDWIRAQAQAMGFLAVGFSKARFLEEEAPRLEKWLHHQHQGKMSYMENHFDLRLDPRKLVPGTKTVISFLYNYFPSQQQEPESPYKISKYAYGEDYHIVIKEKLRELISLVQAQFGAVEGRVFVDSAPVLEKAWAKNAGLGWVGKNANLIHPKEGSFFFLAEWLCDLDLPEDEAMKDYCGRCTRCIDACPTDAIVEPYVVDGSKCISYATIELKDADLPSEFAGKMNNWAFGCDICQDVCPWNRFSKPHSETRFEPNNLLFSLAKSDWEDLQEDVFRALFRKSAVKRTKHAGLQRNIRFIQRNSKA